MQMTSKWCWKLNTEKYPIYILSTNTLKPNFCQFCSTAYRFWDAKLVIMGNALKWPHRRWTLNGEKYPAYTNFLTLRPKIDSVLLYDQPFPRNKVVKKEKWTKWPKYDLKHLTVSKATVATWSCHHVVMSLRGLDDSPSSVKNCFLRNSHEE